MLLSFFLSTLVIVECTLDAERHWAERLPSDNGKSRVEAPGMEQYLEWVVYRRQTRRHSRMYGFLTSLSRREADATSSSSVSDNTTIV